MEKQIRDRLKACHVEGADLEVKNGKIVKLMLH
jgi:hypothetical protein